MTTEIALARPDGPDHRPAVAPSAAGIGWTLLLIVLAGVALRLALWCWFGGIGLRIWDERDYDALATSLVVRGEYGFRPGEPVSIRPPLYPAFLAGVYEVFGLGSFQAVRLLQAAVSLVNVLILYRLGTVVYGPRVGVWLAGLYGFYPSMLGFNNLLLAEVLFTFFLSAACLTLIRSLQTGSRGRLVLAGTLLGLGALTRSVLWVFAPVLTLFLLCAWPDRFPRRLLAAGSLALAFGATIAPWAVRNTRLEKTFLVIDSMGGRNLMMGNYEYTPLHRSWDTISLEGERSWDFVLSHREPTFHKSTQGQIDKLAMRSAITFMVKHPGLTLQRDVVKFFDFWGLERELVAGAAHGYFGRLPIPAIVLLTAVIFGAYAAAMITGIFGMIMTPPSDRWAHRLLLLTIAFVCGMHTLTFGHSRYHLPVMPLVLIYSAGAIACRREIWRRRARPSFALSCGVSLVLILAWSWDVFVVDLHRYWDMLHL